MPAPAYFFAADLGGTKLSVALVRADGRIVARRSEPVETASRLTPVGQMARMAGELRARCGNVKLSAAGVAVPGLVRRDGTVWAPNLPGWTAVPLAKLLSAELRAPVVVESDRNAGVLGETWRGAARGARDAIVLMVGTGIGAGILSGGSLVRGAHELSGCAGWIAFATESNADAKRCGQLESLAAGPGLAKLNGANSAEELAAAARAGDHDARRAFESAGERLGLAVANLISLFDPSVIVLSGGLSHAADLFLPSLQRMAREHAQPLSAPKVKIVVSKLGSEANVLGVARLAIERVNLAAKKKARR